MRFGAVFEYARVAESYWIEDLNSTNGIYLNGARIVSTPRVGIVYCAVRPDHPLRSNTQIGSGAEAFVRTSSALSSLARCRWCTD